MLGERKPVTDLEKAVVKLKEKYPISRVLEDEYRVFGVCVYDDKIYVEEQCDCNYNRRISKTECRELSKYFEELSELCKGDDE